MTKQIKIITENAKAIHDALRAANGKATTHAYTLIDEIQQIAAWGEKRLENLGIPKPEPPGAVFSATSGDQLPNAYKYTAKGTHVELVRRTSGWYLASVQPALIYPGARGTTRWLHLTQKQDAKAIEVLRREYTILPPDSVTTSQLIAQVA